MVEVAGEAPERARVGGRRAVERDLDQLVVPVFQGGDLACKMEIAVGKLPRGPALQRLRLRNLRALCAVDGVLSFKKIGAAFFLTL